MMAKHSAGTSSAVGILPAASLTKPITGVTIPPPIMVMTINDEPYLVSPAQMLNPQREDGRVLNGHKGAAQGQGQQTDVAAAEGGEQTEQHGDKRIDSEHVVRREAADKPVPVKRPIKKQTMVAVR